MSQNLRIIKALKIIAIFIGVSTIGVIALTITVALISGQSEKVIADHPMIGQTFNAGAPVFYMEDCNNFHSCGDTPRDREINRALECGKLNTTVTPIYNEHYQISSETTFELIELLEIRSHGLDTIGGAGYVIAVLRDNNNLLSTILFSSLNQQNKPYGFTNAKICDGLY